MSLFVLRSYIRHIIGVILFLLLPLSLLAAPNKSGSYPHKKSSGASAPVIVIDPGHGGLDLGARSKKPYCEEKRIALMTAQLAKKYLDRLGYRVILTRSQDVFLPLSRRTRLANPSRAALFVSLHYNSCSNASAHGIEVFYCDSKREGARTKSSKKLADLILGDLIKRTKAKSRGVKKGNFYVIRESKVPAVLVEGGFISNPNERSKLRQRDYLDKIARAVADGVDQYFKS